MLEWRLHVLEREETEDLSQTRSLIASTRNLQMKVMTLLLLSRTQCNDSCTEYVMVEFINSNERRQLKILSKIELIAWRLQE